MKFDGKFPSSINNFANRLFYPSIEFESNFFDFLFFPQIQEQNSISPKSPGGETIEDQLRQDQITILAENKVHEKLFLKYLNLLSENSYPKSISFQMVDILYLLYQRTPSLFRTYSQHVFPQNRRSSIKTNNILEFIIFAYYIKRFDNPFPLTIIQDILPQLEKPNQNNEFNFSGSKISEAQALFLCANSIVALKLTENIVKNQFRYLIRPEFPFTVILLYATNSNLIQKIPPEIYPRICQFPNIFPVLKNLIQTMSKPTFSMNYDLFANLIKQRHDKIISMSNQNQETEIANINALLASEKDLSSFCFQMIINIDSFKLTDKYQDFKLFLEFSTADGLSSLLCKHVNDIKIGPHFASLYRDYQFSMDTFLTLHPDPLNVIPHLEFLRFFDAHCASDLDWNKIFISFFYHRPTSEPDPLSKQLHDRSFWMKFLLHVKMDDTLLNVASDIYLDEFKSRSALKSILTFLNNEEMLIDNVYKFISTCYLNYCRSKPSSDIFDEFYSRIKAARQTPRKGFNPVFWTIFPDCNFFAPLISDRFFIYAMTCMLFESNCAFDLKSEIIISSNFPVNDQLSKTYIKSFIESDFKSIHEMLKFFEPNDINAIRAGFSSIIIPLCFAASFIRTSIESSNENQMEKILFIEIENPFTFLTIVLKVFLLTFKAITMPMLKSVRYFFKAINYNFSYPKDPAEPFKLSIIKQFLSIILQFPDIFFYVEQIDKFILQAIMPVFTFVDLMEPENEEIALLVLQMVLVLLKKSNNGEVFASIQSKIQVLIQLFLHHSITLVKKSQIKIKGQLTKFDYQLILDHFNRSFPECNLNYATFCVKFCPLVGLLTLFTKDQIKQALIPIFNDSVASNQQKEIPILIRFFHYSKNDDILIEILNANNNLDPTVKLSIYSYIIQAGRDVVFKNPTFSFNQLIPLSNNTKPLKKSVIAILKSILMDFDVSVNFYRYLFERKMQDHFYLKLDTLISRFYSEEYLRHQVEFCTAICESYHIIDQEILIAKANTLPYRPLSPEIHDFIFNQFIKDPNIEILKEIANLFPFIFNKFDQIKLLEICFQGFKSDQSRKNRANSIIFAIILSTNPHFLDSVFPYIFQNITSDKFSIHDKQFILLLIQSLLLSPSYQFITTGILLVNRWNSIARQLLLNTKNQQIIYFVPQVTLLYLTMLNSLNDEHEILLNNITLDKPFSKTNQGILSLPIPSLSAVQFFFNHFINIENDNDEISENATAESSENVNEELSSQFKNDDEQRNNTYLFVDEHIYQSKKNVQINKEQLKQNLRLARKAERNGNSQEQFNSHLPLNLQSSILYQKVQRLSHQLKHLNTSQKRRLMNSPFWTSQIIQNSLPSPQPVLLTPDHYQLLLSVLSDLINNQNEEIYLQNDLILEEYCQSELIEILLHHYFSSNLSNQSEVTLLKLFNLFGDNLFSATGLVPALNSIVCTNDFIETTKLFKLYLILSQSNSFDDLREQILPTVIRLANMLYESRNWSSLISLLQHSIKMGENMPNSLLMFIPILLLDQTKVNNKSSKHFLSYQLFEEVINLSSQLHPSKMKLIEPYILAKFKQFLNSFNPKKHHDLLALYLTNYPFLIQSSSQALLTILEQLLRSFSMEKLETIGILFDRLAPPIKAFTDMPLLPSLNNSTEKESSPISRFFCSIFGSKQLKPSKKSPLSIPKTLYEKSPMFWQMVIQASPKVIEPLLQDHLFKELRFLTLYPEVLQFKYRIDLFNRHQKSKLKSEIGNIDRLLDFFQRRFTNCLYIDIRRDHLLYDSYNELHARPKEDWFKKFLVNYRNEEGIDAGGLKKDWFSSLIKDLFNPNYALFALNSNGRALQPNPSSYHNPDHINYFNFAGKVLARALIEEVTVEAHLTKAFMKHIIGMVDQMSLSDIEDCDEELYKSFVWILKNDVTPLEIYFIADVDDMGAHVEVNLIENGNEILVTNENKEQFVRLMIKHRLVDSIKLQVKAFLDGFYSLIPYEEIRLFRVDELNLLICGSSHIDLDDFRDNVRIEDYDRNHPVIQMFFDVISKWSDEDIGKLLLFITGSSQVPYGGFRELAINGKPIVIRLGGDKTRFPVSHTCTNTLDLPTYESKEDLESKLLFSINECNTFGLS